MGIQLLNPFARSFNEMNLDYARSEITTLMSGAKLFKLSEDIGIGQNEIRTVKRYEIVVVGVRYFYDELSRLVPENYIRPIIETFYNYRTASDDEIIRACVKELMLVDEEQYIEEELFCSMGKIINIYKMFIFQCTTHSPIYGWRGDNLLLLDLEYDVVITSNTFSENILNEIDLTNLI